jgi:hypothetical protein
MALLVILATLFFPRLGVILLALFSDWFSRAGLGLLALVLGFIFAPVTLIWYSVVMNFFGGQWSFLPIIGLVLALLADFGGGYSGYYHRYYVVED